ncbi:major facilitator superfamily domain-containing protein [Aspergillus ambiguus]|uniref:major facilitator superfamily domain-containing protein n=1 Tax=Aspergillus ambiguus TaxID=176160 RepID=UPI003CCCD811
MARDIENRASQRPDCFSSTVTECLFVLTVTFAFAQSTIFSGMATVMTDSIGRDLDMGNEITWITAAPLLTSGAFVLPFGNVADMVGRKHIFVAAMTISTLTMTIAGFTTNGISLIILNAFFGLCSAAAVTPALGQLGAVYQQPSKRRNRAFACFSAGNPLGYVSGSFISGVVMQLSNWRACFWTFAIVNAIFTILVVWTVPSHSVARKGSLWDMLSRFDLVGALLITGGVSMLSSSLTLGGTAPKGWGAPYVLIPLILGVATIICFILWQAVYKYPLMPLYVWRDLDFATHILSISIGNAGFTAATFWLCLYLQRVKDQSPLSIALYLLPQNVNGVLINICISFLMHRVSHMLITGVGAIAYIVSFLLLALIQPVSKYYWAFIFPSLMLVVVGSELQFNVANSYVMSSLPQARQSLAGGILSAVNKVFSNIALTISTAAYATDLRRTTAGVGQLRLEKGYSGAFWVSVIFAVMDLGLVFFLRADGKGYDKASPQKVQRSSTSDEETGSDATKA